MTYSGNQITMDEREVIVFKHLSIKFSQITFIFAIISIIIKLMIGSFSLLFSFITELTLIIGLIIISLRKPKPYVEDERTYEGEIKYYKKNFLILTLVVLYAYLISTWFDIRYFSEINYLINGFTLIILYSIFNILIMKYNKKDIIYLNSAILNKTFKIYILKKLKPVVIIIMITTMLLLNFKVIDPIINDLLKYPIKHSVGFFIIFIIIILSICIIIYILHSIYEYITYYDIGDQIDNTENIISRRSIFNISWIFIIPIVYGFINILNTKFEDNNLQDIFIPIFSTIMQSLVQLLLIAIIIIIIKFLNQKTKKSIDDSYYKKSLIYILITYITVQIILFILNNFTIYLDFNILHRLSSIFNIIINNIPILVILLFIVFSVKARNNKSKILLTISMIIYSSKSFFNMYYSYNSSIKKSTYYMIDLLILTMFLVVFITGLIKLNTKKNMMIQ